MAAAVWVRGAGPVSLDNVRDPGPNRLDEPLAKSYSLAAGVEFLDSAALTWQKERKCFTCHTNYAHLYARPLVSAEAPVARQVRQFAEQLVSERWQKDGPRWDAEVVATAAALAFNDSATTGKLHATTRQALDRMWSVQKPHGGWDWIKCDWPPLESDDDYGACLAALAVSVAPENYRQTPQAQAGIDKLRGYLEQNPPPSLHHAALLLWASTYGEPFLSPTDRKGLLEKLRGLQRPDGGWSLPSLGDWQRGDKSPQSTDSDGYGTGFVVYILRRGGAAADDPAVRRGVAWLKANQRASGRWITRSLHADSKHFISHAGTAWAIMALADVEPPKDKPGEVGR
jgi:squalene-hopene/tetraprenyl-beta-curcumene cyclase